MITNFSRQSQSFSLRQLIIFLTENYPITQKLQKKKVRRNFRPRKDTHKSYEMKICVESRLADDVIMS